MTVYYTTYQDFFSKMFLFDEMISFANIKKLSNNQLVWLTVIKKDKYRTCSIKMALTCDYVNEKFSNNACSLLC